MNFLTSLSALSCCGYYALFFLFSSIFFQYSIIFSVFLKFLFNFFDFSLKISRNFF